MIVLARVLSVVTRSFKDCLSLLALLILSCADFSFSWASLRLSSAALPCTGLALNLEPSLGDVGVVSNCLGPVLACLALVLRHLAPQGGSRAAAGLQECCGEGQQDCGNQL